MKIQPIENVDVLAIDQQASDSVNRLKQAIEQVLDQEALHEAHAEKYLELYAEHGVVRVPGTNHVISTTEPSILMFGTSDHVFKDYMEKALWPLYARLRKSNGKAWKCVRTVNPKSRKAEIRFVLTRLGEAVMACCRGYDPRWEVAYSHHVFHPIVTLMLRAMRNYAVMLMQMVRHGESQLPHPSACRMLDRLVGFVRRVAHSWPFINAVRARERQAHDNFDSARRLIYQFASENSKLLFIRIDLYRQPYHDVAAGRADIDKFTRWLRTTCKAKLLPGYRGFVIKEENGISRGMHWHLLVIASGNAHCNTDYLTRQLGDEWARRTQQGPGCYHNCYADRARYPANGLGVMGLGDLKKMIGLRRALHYITKQDCVLKPTNEKDRHFWRSPIKPRKEARGRPRSTDDSLRLLKRMLGGKRSKLPPGLGGLVPRGRRLA